MSFERGSIGVTIFRLAKKLPENALKHFAASAAKKLEDIEDEVSVGFTGGRNLLETNINENTCKYGGHIYMNMRIAQRKVSASMLKAECRKEELEYMTMHNLTFIPNKVRRQIRKDIEEKLLLHAQVEIKGIPFVIDQGGSMLYLGTTSPAKMDAFLHLFYYAFGWEPKQLGMEQMLEETHEPSLLPIRFSKNVPNSSNPGRDFLTWLWYHCEENGGKLEINGEECALMVEGPLVFSAGEESEGSRETVVRKDRPTRSAEAKAALAVGKKLRKAKLTLARGEEVWACTLDADLFTFSSLNLPDPGALLDDASWFAERVNSINIFQTAIEGYFKEFIYTAFMGEEQDKILEWSGHRGEY